MKRVLTGDCGTLICGREQVGGFLRWTITARMAQVAMGTHVTTRCVSWCAEAPVFWLFKSIRGPIWAEFFREVRGVLVPIAREELTYIVYRPAGAESRGLIADGFLNMTKEIKNECSIYR